MTIPLSYSSRSLWARRTTTVATAGGIALVVFVLASSQMLSSGMRGTLLKAGSNNKALVLQHGAYAEDDSRIRHTVATLVATAPGVRHGADGAPLITGEALVQIFAPRTDDASRISSVQVRGVSANVASIRPEVRVTSGRLPLPGSDEAMIGSAIDGLYEGLTVGGQLELKKGRKLPIVGAFEAAGSAYESEIWTGLDVVQTSLGWEGYLSSVTASLDSDRAFEAFAMALEADKTAGINISRERAYYDKISEGLSRSTQALGDLMTLIFACGATLGAAITMNGAIAQRRKEIGVLRALGFPARDILLAFLVESGVLALAGALIGVSLASLLSLVHFSTTNYATGNEINFPFELDPAALLRSLIAGTCVGLVGGLLPAVKAARTPPIAAMRA